MLFNSFSFLIFFPIVTILFFLLPQRIRWLHLLVASCIFYMAFIPQYILILAFTITTDYFSAILIERTKNAEYRKLFLALSLFSNVGVLVFFKYYQFLDQVLGSAVQFLGFKYGYASDAIFWSLPIGLSFHTFQAMGYTIDVYRGRMQAEKHFGIFALFVMFFPQLVAGPIERPQNLLHQFREQKYFECERALNGLKLMTWGMFKKIVIADRISEMISPVFNSPTQYSGPALTAAVVFFAYEIYCDFSGYSDIAIGAAQFMGFNLMTNFDRPYWSESIAEFWRRWHISLSTWFRDYVYFPLGGNRVSTARWYANLLIVFLISGIWHGANYTFVVWGLLHGVYIIFGAVLSPLRDRLSGLLLLEKAPGLARAGRICFTFVLVCLGWIFFRARSVHDAFYMISHLGTGWSSGLAIERQITLSQPEDFVIAIGAILYMEAVEYVHRARGFRELFNGYKVWVRWPMYYSMLIGILLAGTWAAKSFIYFQF